MVIVVPALAERHHRNEDVVRRLDRTVVRLVAPDVRRTVHQPRRVKRNRVSQQAAHVPAVGQCLTDHQARQHRWDSKAEQRHQPQVISGRAIYEVSKASHSSTLHSLLLEHHESVLLQIFHVNGGAFGLHLRVLFDHQPAHVGKEHATRHIVRIGIGVGELVMHSVSKRECIITLMKPPVQFLSYR